MGLMSVCEGKRRRHGSYNPAEPEKSRLQATIYFTVPNGNEEERTVLVRNCAGMQTNV